MSRLAVAAALALAAFLQVHRLDDPDTWWHLASGRTIWSTGAVPSADPFSYTAAGAPWLNRQWLFEVLSYGSWRLAGPTGPALLAGGAFLAAFALLAHRLRSLPAWASAAVVVAAVLASVERFAVRPEAATLACLTALLALLDRQLTWRVVAAVVGLQVVWANCHALSVLGLLPIGAALGAGLAARMLPLPDAWRAANARTPIELRQLGGALAGALVAEACTPFGLRGAIYPLYLLSLIGGQQRLSFTIIEHRATSLAELSPVAGAALVTLGVVAALAFALSVRRLRLDHALLAIAFVVLASMARRNVALLGLGVAPLLASGLGPTLRRADDWLRERRASHVLDGAVALAAIALAVRVATGSFYDDAHLTRAFGFGESHLMFSARAVDFLERAAPGARVFNDDILGGYLIWRGHPVFFDGRLQVYPESVYDDYQSTLDDPQHFAAVAARWNITAAILHHSSPGRLELTRAIANLPGWRIAYLDGGAVVLLGDGAPPGDPAGIRDPIDAFGAPGAAAVVERIAAPVRAYSETATGLYERGRAILYLWGARAAPFAREDFRAALALEPWNADAQTGMQATATP